MNDSLATYKVISGTATSLGVTAMPCHNGVVVRAANYTVR